MPAGSTQVAAIRTDIQADAAQFVAATRAANSGMRHHREQVRRTRREYRAMTTAGNNLRTSMRGLVAPIAALASVGGFAALVRGASEYGATMVEASISTGVAVEQLQLLDRVARGDAVSFNTLRRSLEAYQSNLVKAIDGMAEQRREFERLNLSAEQLIRLPIDEQLIRIADALDNVGTNAERVAALRALFGRGGAPLLAVFAEGGDRAGGLRDQLEDARQFDVLTEEQAAALKAVAQELQDTGDAFAAFRNQLVADWAPSIIDGLEGVQEALSAVSDVAAFIDRLTTGDLLGDLNRDLFGGLFPEGSLGDRLITPQHERELFDAINAASERLPPITVEVEVAPLPPTFAQDIGDSDVLSGAVLPSDLQGRVTIADHFDAQIESARRYAVELRRVRLEARRLENIRFLETLAQDLTGAFRGFASETIRNFDDIGDAARRLGLAIADITLQRTVVEPIAGLLASALASGIGNALFPPNFTVGEAALLRRADESVARFSSGTAAQGVVQNNYFRLSGTDAGTARRAVVEAAPYLSRQIRSDVRTDVQRTSSLQKAIREN